MSRFTGTLPPVGMMERMESVADQRERKPAGAAFTLLGDGVVCCTPEARVMEAMLTRLGAADACRDRARTTI